MSDRHGEENVNQRPAGKDLTPELRVLGECLALTGKQLKRTTAIVLPLAGLLAVSLRSSVNAHMSWLWVVMVIAATVLLGYVCGFSPSLDTSVTIENRRNEIVTAVGLLGAAWGSVALLGFPDSRHRAEQLLVVVVLMGVASAFAMATLLVSAAFFGFLVPLFAPIMIRLLISSDKQLMTASAVVLCAIIGMVVQFLSASKAHGSLIRNRLENGLLHTRVVKMREQVAASEAEINRMYTELGEQQVRDEVTGTFNRRQFAERLGAAWQSASGGFDPFSCAFVQVNDFDLLVKEHGSSVCDDLLRKVASALSDSLRTDDSLARLNSAQFALILNNTLTEGALIALERIRRKISSNPIDCGMGILVSISIGLATFDGLAGRAICWCMSMRLSPPPARKAQTALWSGNNLKRALPARCRLVNAQGGITFRAFFWDSGPTSRGFRELLKIRLRPRVKLAQERQQRFDNVGTRFEWVNEYLFFRLVNGGS